MQLILRILLLALFIAMFAYGLFAATQKAIKSTRVSDWQVLVSCQSGAEPKVDKVGGSLVLSCTGRVEQ